MTKTLAERTQEFTNAALIENPWERAIRMHIIETESRLSTAENEIEADINYMAEYGLANLANGTEYLQSLIHRHKNMTDRRDQLKAKLETLEQIVDLAVSKSN